MGDGVADDISTAHQATRVLHNTPHGTWLSFQPDTRLKFWAAVSVTLIFVVGEVMVKAVLSRNCKSAVL